MKRDAKSEAERWLSQARRDLDDAEYLLGGSRFNQTCFLAQQAAEKALKAFLYFRGAERVWGHSVSELCTDAIGLDRDFTAMSQPASALDKYYILTRYPNGLPGGIPADAYLREDAESALNHVRAVMAAVEAKLHRPADTDG